jgi:hypothetical protein
MANLFLATRFNQTFLTFTGLCHEIKLAFFCQKCIILGVTKEANLLFLNRLEAHKNLQKKIFLLAAKNAFAE